MINRKYGKTKASNTPNIFPKNDSALLNPGSALCDTLGFGVFSVEMSRSFDGVLAMFSVLLVDMSSSCDGVLTRFSVVLVDMSRPFDIVTDRVDSESHNDDRFFGDHITDVPFK